jgi:adenylate cyclase
LEFPNRNLGFDLKYTRRTYFFKVNIKCLTKVSNRLPQKHSFISSVAVLPVYDRILNDELIFLFNQRQTDLFLNGKRKYHNMSTTLLSLLLSEQKTGYVIADEQWVVVEQGGDSSVFIDSQDLPTPLLELIPELTCCEDILQDILDGDIPRFQLENLNRSRSNGEVFYLNITLRRYLPEASNQTTRPQLLVIIADTSSSVQTQQTLTQQRNDLRLLQHNLNKANNELKKANQFIRQTFGRYLSDEVVDTILESPDGLSLGGEKRLVSIMMTDLRGFTSLGEQLPADSVVGIINIYLDIMTQIIFKYQGTIDEFIGDAILAVFGAPTRRENDAQRAVACALEMQLAMADVNQRNREAGYPDVTMGIGINTGAAVIGNIGSHRRTKYGVIGRHVNLASRIESYTVGGQVFISESTKTACGSVLRIDDQIEVMPKGVKQPIIISDVGGIGGEFNIFLPEKKLPELMTLSQPIPVKFAILSGKHANQQQYQGRILKRLDNMAEIEADIVVEKLTNLKMTLFDETGHEVTRDFYTKVVKNLSDSPPLFRITSTFIPPEAKSFLERVLVS